MKYIFLLLLALFSFVDLSGQALDALPGIDEPQPNDRIHTYTRGFSAAFQLDTLRKYFAADIVEGLAVDPYTAIPDSLRGRFFTSTSDSLYFVDYNGEFYNFTNLQKDAQTYTDDIGDRAARARQGLSANLAYKIGVDTFAKVHQWFVGDSKLNQVHTISRIQANYGAAFGFAGNGYLSLSTANNGTLGMIPRATGSTAVEYPATVFAGYSLDGQAQELTGTGDVRIEPNDNYTTYTDDITCTYWDYASINYLRHTSGGDIAIIIDGTPIDTVDANGAEAKINYEITGLADTAHTLTLKNISGTNYTLDGYFLRSSISGVVVHCLANSGYDADNFNDLLGRDNKEALVSNPPDGVVIRLGANDSNRDFTPTAFATNVAEIVDTLLIYSPSSDVLLMGMEGMALGTTYTDAEYNTALSDTAEARYWNSASLYDIIPNMADFQARGFSSDGTHENAQGSHVIGNFIFNAAVLAGGSGSGPTDTPSLQAVTDVGATTDNPVIINSYMQLQDANGNSRNGIQTGEDLTTGVFNVMRGYQVGLNTTTGSYNVFDGYQAAYRNTTGEKNVVIGVQSLFNNKTGSQNFALGGQAGQFVDGGAQLNTANQSIYFGPLTEAAYDNPTNENVFGYDAIGNGSNSFTFGNDNVDSTFLKGRVHVEDIYATGKIGVGIKEPTAGLHVYSETLNAEARIEAGQYATFYISSDLSSTGDRDPTFRFATEGVERWRVGVDQSNSNGFSISNGSLGTSSSIFIRESNGYVGIFQNPSRELDVDGRVRIRSMPSGVATGLVGHEADGDLSDFPLDETGIYSGSGEIPTGTEATGDLRPSGYLGNRFYYAVAGVSSTYHTGFESLTSTGTGFKLDHRTNTSDATVSTSLELLGSTGETTLSNNTWYWSDGSDYYGFNLSTPSWRVGTTDFVDMPTSLPSKDNQVWKVDDDGNGAWYTLPYRAYSIRNTDYTTEGSFSTDTDLTLTVPGGNYDVEATLVFEGNMTTSEITYRLTASTGNLNTNEGNGYVSLHTNDIIVTEFNDSFGENVVTATANTRYEVHLKGTIKYYSGGGTVAVQFGLIEDSGGQEVTTLEGGSLTLTPQF